MCDRDVFAVFKFEAQIHRANFRTESERYREEESLENDTVIDATDNHNGDH